MSSMERPPLPEHPVDERGLAVIPAGISLECDPEACEQRQPMKNRQHVYHPKSRYEYSNYGADSVTSEFRNLGCNVLRMCMCQHNDWDHGIQPPPMPSREVMQQVIEEYKAGEYQIGHEQDTYTVPRPRPVQPQTIAS